MPETTIQHGLTIQLALKEHLPCGCCYKVDANTILSLPLDDDDTEGQLSSLIAHVGIQVTLALRTIAPELTNDQAAAFISSALRDGVVMALAGGEVGHD